MRRRKIQGLWERDGVYYSRFKVNGREVRKRLSTDFGAAVEILNDLKARADKADFGLIDNDYPYADLKSKFLKWVDQSLRRPDEYKRHLRRFEEFNPVKNVRQITSQYAIEFRNQREAGPRTINLEVATLRNMLNKGVEWKLIGSNQIAGLKPLKVDDPAKQRRSLTAAELLRLLEVTPDYLKPVWRMLMSSGIRKEELVELTWKDVDLQRAEVTIRAGVAKSRKSRTIPLDDGMAAILRKLQKSAGKSAHVFLNKVGSPHRNNLLTRFYTCCKRAAIADGKRGGSIDLHSLRVTFTTLALENGANPKAVQEILGHSTLTMTMNVYAKATETAKRAAVNIIPFGARTANN